MRLVEVIALPNGLEARVEDLSRTIAADTASVVLVVRVPVAVKREYFEEAADCETSSGVERVTRPSPLSTLSPSSTSIRSTTPMTLDEIVAWSKGSTVPTDSMRVGTSASSATAVGPE